MKTEVLTIILMSLWRQKIREDPSAKKKRSEGVNVHSEQLLECVVQANVCLFWSESDPGPLWIVVVIYSVFNIYILTSCVL